MVERTVCSTGEETETCKSLNGASSSIETPINRNDDFQPLKTAERSEKLGNCEISPEPEIAKILEATRVVSNRDGGITTGAGRFSLFKWFKRGSRESASSSSSSLCDPCEHRKRSNKGQKVHRPKTEEINEDEVPSDLSSNESVETLYSTATVRSFAFRTGTLTSNDDVTRRDDFSTNRSPVLVDNTTRRVGPFGFGAAKLTAARLSTNDIDVTKTLPANVLSKRRDITARYSLQPCTSHSGGFGSCGNFGSQRDSLGGTLRRLEDRGGRVHVRGKRRAPNPPVGLSRSKNAEEVTKISRTNGRRKRRPAPKPPDTNFAKSKVSVNLVTNEQTGSANLPNTRETTNESSPSKEETRSTSSSNKRETGSATLPMKEEIGSANLATKNVTGSAIFLTKEKTGGAILRVKEETVSAIFSGKEEIRSAILPRKEETGSTEGMNIGEANGKDKIAEKLNKEDKGIITTNIRTISDDVCYNSERTTTVTTDRNFTRANTKDHENIVSEGLKNKNCNFLRSAKNSDDVTNSIAGTTGDINKILLKSKTLDISSSISNDSLVLQGGVLHSKREINLSLAPSPITGTSEIETTPRTSKGRISITTGSQTSTSAMPRPWYKRSVFEHSRDSGTSRRGDVLRNPTQPEMRDESVVNTTVSGSSSSKSRHGEKTQDGGTLSKLNFFHRSEKNNEEKKKENKRKSGLSILTNISELDKEAAAIVQEEQARTRAASMLLQASRSNDQTNKNDETEDVVQDMVTSAMESSPRRGTRALISKFNAIGNITKVTVNTSFFAKNPYPRDPEVAKSEISKNSSSNECWRERGKFSKSENVRVDKDLSRYFLPAQKTSRNTKIDEIGENTRENTSKNSKADISARLSFFQGFTGEKKDVVQIVENTLETKITRLNKEVVVRDAKNTSYENSPKFSRLRVNVPNECNDGKSGQQEINDDINREINENIGRKNREIVQKEFSNIFKEIDGKFASGEFRDDDRETIGKKNETASSSQVSRVLDILVEAEKNDRQKTNSPGNNRENEFFENCVKSEKQKISSTNAVEKPMTTDLKEMLKEMKHSLPKRPKQKKLSSQQILLKNDEQLPNKKNDVFLVDNKKNEIILLDHNKSDNSHLLSPVTVAYPPPIRIGPPCDKVEKMIFRANEEREYDRQKVSSSVQTSGNVRKVNRQTGPSQGESSRWRNEDVVYKTSGKGVATAGTSGLTKNTFQLIRPREFAQIEAIKTMKNSSAENTYANVIEQSLYANALVLTTKKIIPEISQNKESRERINLPEEKKLRINEREIIERETMAQDTRVVEQQNMNTLAVNRLLRKLEAAIASGHHQQAAGLAKELARLKIHCSVVRQRTKAKDVVNVNMYIEDKLAHQGPIPLRLARSMTVAQLKTKVFTEFEIPTNVQRWIVGKNLADNDATTLEELQAVEGSPVFLYLVAPELKNDESSLRGEKVPLVKQEATENLDPEPINEIMKLVEVEEPDEEAAESEIVKDEDEEECISEEVKMERYEALISLENCDVIPNSEPIECPICFVTYGPQEGVILRDCLHMFCRPCIANTIRYCDEAEVKCPYRDTEYTCESTLQEREIKALVEPEVYQQHLAKSIAQAENNAGNNAFHCKTPDCPGWCIYDDNVNNFLCPVCGVNNCLTCQVVHTGKNCRQYQEELRLSKETDQESKRTAAMLEEMVDRGEALPCPTCAVVLMKKWGCDWLRCSMCKTEICWVTRGPRWGPGGKGDTSGGCRCGENGVKCHPRCNYCH